MSVTFNPMFFLWMLILQLKKDEIFEMVTLTTHLFSWCEVLLIWVSYSLTVIFYLTEWGPFLTMFLHNKKFKFLLRIRHDKRSWVMTWLVWSSDLEWLKLLRTIYQRLLYWIMFQLHAVCENLDLKGECYGCAFSPFGL